MCPFEMKFKETDKVNTKFLGKGIIVGIEENIAVVLHNKEHPSLAYTLDYGNGHIYQTFTPRLLGYGFEELTLDVPSLSYWAKVYAGGYGL